MIDPGSYKLKAGFAGDDAPRVVISSVVGRPRFKQVTITRSIKESAITKDMHLNTRIL